MLAVHLAVEAVLAGTASLLLPAALLDHSAVHLLEVVVATAAGAHLVLRVLEVSFHHPTAQSRLAVWEMTHGRFAAWFLLGGLFVALGILAPFLGWWAAIVALAGVLAQGHAYVQAAQAVPLA